MYGKQYNKILEYIEISIVFNKVKILKLPKHVVTRERYEQNETQEMTE